MIRNKIARWLLIWSVSGITLLAYALSPQAQEETKSDYKSSVLLPLVGEKVKVFLTSGEQVKGTLWDFENDFVSIKSKKGLLYSKTEKIAFIDIAYIEDPNGLKISALEMEAMEAINSREAVADADADKKSTLYFHTDDLLQTSAKQPEKEDEVQKTFTALDGANKSKEKSQVAAETRLLAKGTKARTEGKRVSGSARPKGRSSSVYFNRKSRRAKAKQAPKEAPTKSLAENKKTPPPKAPDRSKSKEVAAPALAAQKPSLARQKHVAIAPSPEPRTARTKVLAYQNVILFAAASLAFALLIMMKVKEARRSAYGEESLFPAKVVKMNGKYGLIDQGTADGLKLGEVMKLYRKEGKHIDFKGKAYVRKVTEKFSIVETIQNGKFNTLEIGDVGFLDRSFVSKGTRGLRQTIGNFLGGLAKRFSTAAASLGGRSPQPEPNPTVVQPARPITTRTVITRPTVRPNGAHRPQPRQQVTTVKTVRTPKPQHQSATQSGQATVVRTHPTQPVKTQPVKTVKTVPLSTQPQESTIGFGLNDL